MNVYQEILAKLEAGEAVALETKFRGESGLMAEDMTCAPVPVVPEADAKGRLCAKVTLRETDDTLTVTEPMLPQERLLVLGGGHIALHVAEFAAKCGFHVIVADDRPDFANHERFPLADEVICDSFENAIRRVKLTPYDYVVIITRGHRHDADCLRILLPGVRPAYTGLIGSRRRVKGLMEMLAEEGYSTERMQEICTPIGLSIGAVTPQEIAVSILAELIAYKRLPEHSDGTRCCCDSDMELSTLQYLAENRDPKAIVTVIETKGSTPREAGAKMAVSPLGQVTGSIGGVSYVLPSAGTYNYTEIDAYLDKMLSSDPAVREDAKIEVLNGSTTSGVAATEKEKLEKANLTVSTIGDAPTKTYEGYTLYIINPDMTGTKSKLEKMYKITAKSSDEIPAGIRTNGYDFILIVGATSDTKN